MNTAVLYGMPPIDTSPRTSEWAEWAPVQRDNIRKHLREAITAALDARLYPLANTITMALAELEKTP